MLAGQPPFPEGNAYQKIQQHLSHPLPEIGLFAPDVASALALILNRLTAKDPADRFQTPAQLLAALEALEQDMQAVPSSGSVVVPEELRTVVAQAAEESTVTTRSRSWREYLVPSLITVAIALTILAALALLTRGGDSPSDGQQERRVAVERRRGASPPPAPQLPAAPFHQN